MDTRIVRRGWRLVVLAALCFAVLPEGIRAADVTAPPPADKPGAAAPADDEEGGGITRVYDVHDCLWIAGTGEDPAAGGDGTKTRKALSAELIKLLTETVEPGSWIPQGGTSFIAEHDGRITIRTDAGTHATLADILSQLRESTPIQGVALDCQLVIADKAFVDKHAPGVTKPVDAGASARAIRPLQAKELAEAARAAAAGDGVIVVPASLPLTSLGSSLRLGPERRVKLPLLRPDGKAPVSPAAFVETVVHNGVRLDADGVYDGRYVTLDLTARSGELDFGPDVIHAAEAAYRGTFMIEGSGSFLVCAPLVRVRLAGVRELPGPTGMRREVVRDVAPQKEQPDPTRYLLVIGTARVMSAGELTLLAGERVAKLVKGSHTEAFDAPPAPPGTPGQPPPAPPKPPAVVRDHTRVFNLRPLLMGSEDGAEQVTAREKRLKELQARVVAATRPDLPVRVVGGFAMIITANEPDLLKVQQLIETLKVERLLRPE
jgi:hypothetical protein